MQDAIQRAHGTSVGPDGIHYQPVKTFTQILISTTFKYLFNTDLDVW